MAHIMQKTNGTYLVRISCGRDIMTGKQILRGRIFKPSKPNLSSKRFEKSLVTLLKALPTNYKARGIEKSRKTKLYPTSPKSTFLFSALPFPPELFSFTKKL